MIYFEEMILPKFPYGHIDKPVALEEIYLMMTVGVSIILLDLVNLDKLTIFTAKIFNIPAL